MHVFLSCWKKPIVKTLYRCDTGRWHFTDMAIPLDHDQNMMKPVVEGRLLQSLELKPDETVLEIGTGSGFITACLAQMAKRVVSVDIHEQFTHQRQKPS